MKANIDFSLKELYDRFATDVFNLALHYTQNQQDAEEIVQDVFLKIHQQLNGFRAESSIKTWIYRITIHQSLDFIKAKKRAKRFAFWTVLNAQNEPLHQDHPGALLENKEAIRQLFDCINRLPDQQRTALILNKIEQLSQQDIAQILKITPKAVESLVQRAKKKLNELLTQTRDDY